MNYKRKSRRRFFLLVRSRTSSISSEFRGGFEHPKPPLGTPLPMQGNVTLTGKRRGAYRVLMRKPEDRTHLESLSVDRMIILRRILKR